MGLKPVRRCADAEADGTDGMESRRIRAVGVARALWRAGAMLMGLGVLLPGWAAEDRAPSSSTWLQPEHFEVMGCAAPGPDLHWMGANRPGNLYFPSESVDLTVRITSEAGAMKVLAVEVIEIASRENRWLPRMNEPGTAPLPAIENLGVRGRKDYAVEGGADETRWVELEAVPVPTAFGTYAITVAPDGGAPRFLGTVARIMPPDQARGGWAPILGDGEYITQDTTEAAWVRERAAALARLGVEVVRLRFTWNEPVPGRYEWSGYDRVMESLEEAGLKALVSLSGHPAWSLPFGEPTPAVVREHPDQTCDPKFHAAFGRYVYEFCQRYWRGGKGALWAVEHWHQPWEGFSTSGWQSDARHYRALLEQMARNARRVDPRIRTAAAGSILNTEVKLAGGDDPREHLRWVDVFTEHYLPPEIGYGPMAARHWGKESLDSEVWVGANEVLVGQAAVQWLASGHGRVGTWHASMLAFAVPGAPMRYQMPTPAASATAALNSFLKGRRFRGLLFPRHLPWAFQFGERQDAVVVLLGGLLPLGRSGVEGLPWKQLAGDAPGTLLIDNPEGELEFYDAVGNPVFVGEATVRIPGTAPPHYVWSPRGGEAGLRRGLGAARLEGFRPVEIVARDFLVPPTEPNARLRVTLHNLLNREIEGQLKVTSPRGMRLEPEDRPVRLGRGETRDIQFAVVNFEPSPANAYPMVFEFESSAGTAAWQEVLHDLVVRRTRILVDGRLDDWQRIPPVRLYGFEAEPEELGMSFDAIRRQRTNAFLGEFRMAWDERHLYLAARVQDPTSGPLKQRLATRDEDQYFRGIKDDAICEQLRPFARLLERLPDDLARWGELAPRALEWPALQQLLSTNAEARAAVVSGAAQTYFRAKRRDPAASFASAAHVYRKLPWPDQPQRGDTLQFGLDLLPGYEHHRLDPGTARVAPGFQVVPDTDYEFCIYLCEDGKPEVWRLLAPGIPRSDAGPRRVAARLDQGPVAEAEAVVVRSGSLLTYEVAIPWSAMAEWEPRVGATFGAVFRFNNDTGPPLTFGDGKSATKANGLTLHPHDEASASCGVEWILGP
jgi:hypothetical protein